MNNFSTVNPADDHWEVGDLFTDAYLTIPGVFQVISLSANAHQFIAVRHGDDALHNPETWDKARCKKQVEPPTHVEIKAAKQSLKSIARELETPIWEYRIWADPKAIEEFEAKGGSHIAAIWSFETRCEVLNWHKRGGWVTTRENALAQARSHIQLRAAKWRRKQARRETPWTIDDE